MLSLLLVCVAVPPLEIGWDDDIRAEAQRGGFVTAVEKQARGAHQTVASTLALPYARPVRIAIHSAERYAQLFGAQAADSRWAHYFRGEIHVNGGMPITQSFVGLLHHEMCHAVLDGGGRAGLLPIWLNEGLAEYFRYQSLGRGGVDQVQRIYLKDAERDGELRPLFDLPHFMTATQYLQSYAAVTYLAQGRGIDAVLSLVRKILSGNGIDAALTDTMQMDRAKVEKSFFAWVKDFDG